MNREFEKFLKQRGQGRKDSNLMSERVAKMQARADHAVLLTNITTLPTERNFVQRHQFALHIAATLLVAGGSTFLIDRPGIGEACGKDGCTSTSTATPTRTPTAAETATATPTGTPIPRVTVIVPGQGSDIRIDNSNSNTESNQVINRLIDVLLNPSGVDRAKQTDTPRPTDTPTNAQIEANRLAKEKEEAALEAANRRTQEQIEALRNPSPTPNWTAIKEAGMLAATVTRQANLDELERRSSAAKTATAKENPDLAEANKEAEDLAKDLEAARAEARNKKTEAKIAALRGYTPTPTPAAAPGAAGRDGGGFHLPEGFPYIPREWIIAGTVLGAIYLLRRRFVPAGWAPAGWVPPAPPPAGLNRRQRIYVWIHTLPF